MVLGSGEGSTGGNSTDRDISEGIEEDCLQFEGTEVELLGKFEEWQYDKVVKEGSTRNVYVFSAWNLRSQFPVLQRTLHHLRSEEKLVMKVYHGHYENQKYLNESNSLRKITEYNKYHPTKKFSIPKFYHSGALIMTDGDKACRLNGKFILSEYIRNDPKLFTADSFLNALQDLEILKALGISHNEVHPKNLLMRNEEVIFIDFSEARLGNTIVTGPKKYSDEQVKLMVCSWFLPLYYKKNGEGQEGMEWDPEYYDESRASIRGLVESLGLLL